MNDLEQSIGTTHRTRFPADRMLSADLSYTSDVRPQSAAPYGIDTSMKFSSTRLIAADIKAMIGFYEMVTGGTAEWLAPQFAEIVTSAATLAIGSAETVLLFAEGSAEPAANRTAMIEFMVADVDTEFERLKDKVHVVHEPKMMPWGNRSVQFRDPEGTIVALFTPITDAAKERFAAR